MKEISPEEILEKALDFVDRVNRSDIDVKNFYCSIRSDYVAKFKRFIIRQLKNTKKHNIKTFDNWTDANKYMRSLPKGPGFVTMKGDTWIIGSR